MGLGKPHEEFALAWCIQRPRKDILRAAAAAVFVGVYDVTLE